MKRHGVKPKEIPKLNVYKQHSTNIVFRNSSFSCPHHISDLVLTPGIIHLTKYIHK